MIKSVNVDMRDYPELLLELSLVTEVLKSRETFPGRTEIGSNMRLRFLAMKRKPSY